MPLQGLEHFSFEDYIGGNLQSGATFAEVEKILLCRFDFFSTFLTAARSLLRISAYLSLQIGSFF